ncbi:hypothetical protein C8A03DRAFT_45051 [Achaetomium macrosporum]|uniref:Bromodomain associated domain-containing protein n=1 Tax=Achaetomium macrosporum TaxID=79813 RepID=A0AAN7HB57_9PEZI|nr:hypothetical protein C8A03DRAFT_45051 [Achaetomium macrosporum]
MAPPLPLFHALLRPAVLQILRATGYHAAKPSVIDSVTDLAARYFLHLCRLTALYSAHNNEEIPPVMADGNGASLHPTVPAPTIVDVRLALQRAGVLKPERILEEQEYLDAEDTRGVEAFVAWAMGPLNREITRIALDGNDEAADYLDALKKKHSKNDDDSKYLGTVLGRSIEHGDVLVEGGEHQSIFDWEEQKRLACQKPPDMLEKQINGADINGDGDGDGEGSRPPSSGLSSLGGRSIADEMDLS